MRKLLLIIALAVVLVETWISSRRGNGGPRYGSVPIYPNTPYRSIYVGLEAQQEQAWYDLIAKYCKTNGIRRCNPYIAYSGPPLATFTGNDIAIFLRSQSTAMYMTNRDRLPYIPSGFDFCHWPTNGSRAVYNGHQIQMPFTGLAWVSAFGTNYSQQEFRQVSAGLVAALRSAFTNRSVDVFNSDGSNP